MDSDEAPTSPTGIEPQLEASGQNPPSHPTPTQPPVEIVQVEGSGSASNRSPSPTQPVEIERPNRQVEERIVGQGYTTVYVNVGIGEDIELKVDEIVEQEEPRAVAVVSATGSLSLVTHARDGYSMTFEGGPFQIVALSGYFVNRIGRLTITFNAPDGEIFTGVIIAPAVAATQVMVTLRIYREDSGGPSHEPASSSTSRFPRRELSYSSGSLGSQFSPC